MRKNDAVSAEKSGVIARKSNGDTIQLTRRQAKAYAVLEKQDIEVWAYDKLLLQANWRDKNFRATNGELVIVANVEDDRIRLTDGRQLPAEYRQFTHGYAVTAHRSQGKTADFEIIAAQRMPQDLFYVSATRAREGLTVITGDSLALQESIGVSGDRQSASELTRRRRERAGPVIASAKTSNFTKVTSNRRETNSSRKRIIPILTQQVSVSDDWHIDESDAKPASLLVQLRRSPVCCRGSRFVYGRAMNPRCGSYSPPHLVTVSGHGSAALLAAISAHRVVRLIQPTNNGNHASVPSSQKPAQE